MLDEESGDTVNMPVLRVLALADAEQDQENSYDPYNTATNLVLPAEE